MIVIHIVNHLLLLLQLLYGAGQGVLHLGLQIIIVVLLLSVGDVMLGLDQEFIRSNGKKDANVDGILIDNDPLCQQLCA